MKKTKLLALVITLAMLAGLFVACGNDAPTTTDDAGTADVVTDDDADAADDDAGAADDDADETDDAAGADDDAGVADDAEAAAETVTLTFWHIWGTAQEATPPLLRALEAFPEAHPNIIIADEAYTDADFKVAIHTAMAANAAPDLFYGWVPGFNYTFIRAGRLLALDEFLDDGTLSRLGPGALTNVTFHGTVYGLPGEVWCSPMFYNLAFFEEHDLEVPKTWDELLAVTRAFADAGVQQPIALGFRDSWYPGYLLTSISAFTFGAENGFNTLMGLYDSTFEHPDFILAIERMMELIDATGQSREEIMAIGYDEMVNSFLIGNAAMVFDGSWNAGQYGGAESPIRDYLYMDIFPQYGDGPNQIVAGSSGAFSASSSTAHPAEAATALIFISENLSKYAYLDGFGLPNWIVDVDETQVPDLTLRLVEILRMGDLFTLNFDNMMGGHTTQEFLSLLEERTVNRVSSEDFAARLQRALEEELADEH